MDTVDKIKIICIDIIGISDSVYRREGLLHQEKIDEPYSYLGTEYDPRGSL
jgi:hypothetical protein